MSDAAPARPDYARLLAGGFDLRGRVAFVPGGYGGIGEAIAWGLAHGRRPGRGRRPERRQGRGAGRAAAGAPATRRSAWPWTRTPPTRSAPPSMRSPHRFGALDLLVNCIGIQREERLAEVTEAAFDEVVQVNLKAAMFLAQAAARHQVAAVAAGRAPGRQVHLLSVRAQLGMRDRGYSAYCATKGALVMLIKQHAVELVGARHHRQRRRADGGARRDGRALAGQPGDPRAHPGAHSARPRRRARGRGRADALLLQPGARRSSPGRS